MTHVHAEAERSISNAVENREIKLGKYRHFKGGEYEVIRVAKHSETLEDLVVYKALYGNGEVWVRPLKDFLETIEVDGVETPRFTRLS